MIVKPLFSKDFSFGANRPQDTRQIIDNAINKIDIVFFIVKSPPIFISLSQNADNVNEYYLFRRELKSDKICGILIFCGQTASQEPQPMHALGRLSSGREFTYIGAKNPPPVNDISLYSEISFGISRPCGQYSVQ
mgnify:CR=1 FL=1